MPLSLYLDDDIRLNFNLSERHRVRTVRTCMYLGTGSQIAYVLVLLLCSTPGTYIIINIPSGRAGAGGKF